MTFLFVASESKCSVTGCLADSKQTLTITLPIVRHVRQHRQLTPWSREAGGQLFGTINASQIVVASASGPYFCDKRSRYSYRSNPRAAQRAIKAHHKQGFLYLGEWHTHAEDCPNVSSLDDDAMQRLIANSQLNSNALLMMIVGRNPDATGLKVWSVSRAMVSQWHLREGINTV